MTDENLEATSSTSDLVPDAVPEVSVSDKFVDSLPEDLQKEASLQDFKDVAGLAKSYVNAQAMLGRSVRIPTEDASEEVRKSFFDQLESVTGVVRLPNDEIEGSKDRFFNALGRPETSDQYKLDFPDSVSVDAEDLSSFTSMAHDIGLNNDQVSKLVAFESERSAKAAKEMEESCEASAAVLKEHWGTDSENRLAGAKAVLNSYREKYPDDIAAIEHTNLGNNPALAMMLSELGKTLQEEGSVSGMSGIKYGTSVDEAKVKIEEIMENLNHPYHDAGASTHKEAVQRMQRLYGIVYPED